MVLRYLGNVDNENAHGTGRIVELEHQVGQFNEILRASQIFHTIYNYQELLERIPEIACELTQTEACTLFIYHPEESGLQIVSTNIPNEGQDLIGAILPEEAGVAGWVFKRGTPLLNRQVEDAGEGLGYGDEIGNFAVGSVLSVPLRTHDQLVGVLEFLNKTDDIGFVQGDILIASTLATHAAIALENAQKWEQKEDSVGSISTKQHLQDDFVQFISRQLKEYFPPLEKHAQLLRAQGNTEEYSLTLKQMHHLRSLVDDCLNIRYLHQDQDLPLKIFSMRELLTDILQELQPLIRTKQIKVKVQFSEGKDPVNIEAHQEGLGLALSNLISNALKFTPERGGILLGLGRKGDTIVIRIADTGAGIAPDDQKTLFDLPDELAFPQEAYQGLSIGLGMSKMMIEFHHGDLKLNSKVGKGTQFTITLPTAVNV